MTRKSKVNAMTQKVDIGALARRKDGNKGQMTEVLTEGEKVQVAIMMERLNLLQTQLDQIKGATAELITSIVIARGLDPVKYGVNLAAGKVLPVGEPQPELQSRGEDDGEKG